MLFSTECGSLTGGHERGSRLHDGEEQEGHAHRRRTDHSEVQKAQREAPPDAHMGSGQTSAAATKETGPHSMINGLQILPGKLRMLAIVKYLGTYI